MFTIENCVTEFQNTSFEIKPDKVIKSVFISWLYNEKTGELEGMERGNKAYSAFCLMEYLKKMRKANFETAIKLTKEQIFDEKAKNTSDLIEDFFIGWLGTNTSNIGGEYDVQIYQVINKLKYFFGQLNVIQYHSKKSTNE